MANETNGIGIVVPENSPRLGGVDRNFGEQNLANQSNKKGAVGNPAPLATDIPSKNTVIHANLKGIAGVVDNGVQNQLNDRAGTLVNSAVLPTPPFVVLTDKVYINNSAVLRDRFYSEERQLNVVSNLMETI